MKKPISTEEPAERPFNVALSHAEIIALSNWHCAQMRALKPRVGKILMKPGISKRDSASIIKLAQRQLTAHGARARCLLSILPK